MGKGSEPSGGGGDIAVPPELRALLDTALAAEKEAATNDDPAAVEALIDAWTAVSRHEGFGTAPPTFQAAVFNSWGHALELRYVAKDVATDLDAAIAAIEAALATAPADAPSRQGYLYNLRTALRARLARSEPPTDLDAFISASQQAVDAGSPDDQERPVDLTILANSLKERYGRTGALADLEAAIIAYQQALDATAADDPDRPAMLTNLGTSLNHRYGRTGDAADLEAGIAASREALETATADDPNRATMLGNLGVGLRDRFARTGDPADLEAAIADFEAALEATPIESGGRAGSLGNLGLALRDRYTRTGAVADLDAAIHTLQQALEATPVDDPDRPGNLNNLGLGLIERYARTGSPIDLETAIAAFRDTVESTPSTSLDRPMYLANLGTGLRLRYARSGSAPDLEAAVEAYQEAVDTTPTDDVGRASRLTNLGTGLSDRYVRTGTLADLEAAITAYGEAVAATPAGASNRPLYLANLGGGLHDRYARTGSLADLEIALSAFADAVRATEADSPDRPAYLSNLGAGLQDRYAQGGDPADLNALIEAFEEALAATSSDSPHRPARLSNLGAGLAQRYELTRSPDDLDAAIADFQQALDASPADAPDRPSYLKNLGRSLLVRFAASESPADLKAAGDAFRGSCQEGLTVDPAVTLSSAQAWGASAGERDDWVEAAEAYGYGLAAIDRLYETQLLPGAKQTWLADAQGMAASAAFAAARTGDVAAAFLALERGRARLLTEAIQRDQTDLADVEKQDSGAYIAYESAAARMRTLERQERLTASGPPVGPPDVGVERLPDQARQARADLDAAIERIRQLPGHASFAQPPTFDEVALAAEPGTPVAAVVSTTSGSLTLLMGRKDDAAAATVEAIWAPELTTPVLGGLLVATVEGNVVGGYLAGQLGDPAGLETALADGLPKIGASLLGPLAKRLRELDASGVVLLPTGPYGMLPLHAAPYPVDGEERCLVDEFDVSYTPGARVLGAARATLADRDAQPAVFVGVGNPQPHPQPLAFARGELEAVARYFPEAATHALYETAATESALVALLPEATHVHLACHGRFDAETPLDSCLELAQPDPPAAEGDEGRLRLLEILASDWFGRCRLIVLSACQTAITDARRLPDEAIGLPAGLLQAGVPGVVGTLWSVDDLSTTLMMTKFYAYFRHGDPKTDEGPLAPAAALRRAQGWLRTRTADDLVALFEAQRTTVDAALPAEGMLVSEDAASAALLEFGLQDPSNRPYEAPYYWAPFVAIGA